jgi:hypothetical protein
MPLPRRYETLASNWLKSLKGGQQTTPFRESRQFYFGSLLNDSSTFLREWPHVPFAVGWGRDEAVNGNDQRPDH